MIPQQRVHLYLGDGKLQSSPVKITELLPDDNKWQQSYKYLVSTVIVSMLRTKHNECHSISELLQKSTLPQSKFPKSHIMLRSATLVETARIFYMQSNARRVIFFFRPFFIRERKIFKSNGFFFQNLPRINCIRNMKRYIHKIHLT